VLPTGAGTLPPLGGCFLLALDAGWLEMLPAACLRQDTLLLHLLAEATQHAVKGFAFCQDYVGQTFNSSYIRAAPHSQQGQAIQ